MEDESIINVSPEDYILGRTYEEKQLLFKATNGIKHTVFSTSRINIGNYEHIDLGLTISVPLGMTTEELFIWNKLTEEAIQRGIDIINNEMESRTKRVRARLKTE